VRADRLQDNCAVLTGVAVYFDLDRRRAIPLPDTIRAAALAALGDGSGKSLRDAQPARSGP
jgi:hypothetical protein